MIARVDDQNQSDGKMSTTEQGTLFELLIQRLQQILLPGDLVEHNVSVRAVNTGQPRQVDIVVRRSDPRFLLVIECRDHKEPQSATWVEEAYGRKRSLRADAMVLVSSSGFYEPAKLAAQDMDIILRTYQETCDPSVIRGLLPSWVKMTRYCHEFKDMTIKTIPSMGAGTRPMLVEGKYFTLEDSEKMHVRALMGQLVPPGHEVWEKVPADGTRCNLTLNLVDEAPRNLLFHYEDVTFGVEHLSLIVQAWKEVYEPDSPKLVAQYAEVGDEGQPLWRTVYRVDLPNEEHLMFEIIQDNEHLKQISQRLDLFPVVIEFRARVAPEEGIS